MPPLMQPIPDPGERGPVRCRLDHELFARLGAAAFRRSLSDGAAMLVIPLGALEASMPLGALQRMLAIADDSADGRMLHQIAMALDFVAGLALGDILPAEIVSGEASWRPRPYHGDVAMARLRQNLLRWLRPGADAGAIDRDPRMRAMVQAAFAQAACELGLSGGQEVLACLGVLAGELAFIEALRDELHGPVRRLDAGLSGMDLRRQRDLQRREILCQVSRLCGIAAREIGLRFHEVDEQSAAVMVALRNGDSQRSLIRSHRDSLYRLNLAWRPILAEWDRAGTLGEEEFWRLIARTYQFLARRYRPVTEWRRCGSECPKVVTSRPEAMVW